MEHPIAYIPMDRRHALAAGRTLPDRTQGAALFADISGFTPLTETLVRELGPQRGAEELTHYLNLVYDALIDELHRYGGSVIAFAGDAITCWLDGDDGVRTTAAALSMQRAMRAFAAITTPGGNQVALAMKAAIASGPVRRFLVGDPALRLIDAIAGETLVRLAGAEHLAQRGEVVIDEAALAALGPLVQLGDRREDAQTGQRVAVVTGLQQPVAETPWPPLGADALPDKQLRCWLLAPVYERLCRGLGNFLAELRPTVALFVRFSGIDYDHDQEAGVKLDQYIRWVQTGVERYEGTLIDLNIGDKGSYLYINFGAPLTHEDNADRAALTALALRTMPPALSYLEPMQIGISQGRMRAGAYGGANHRTYGVLGDAVNLAARLMMAARPGQILVSEEAQRSLNARFVLDSLPPIQLKGKREPATIFALMGIQQGSGLQITAPAYQLPMVGRQHELRQAAGQLAQAAQGRGQILGVTAAPGLGKSRLVAEIITLASEHGFALYGGECESYGVNSSYLVWQSIWRALFGLESSWSTARQSERLQAKLQTINPHFLARLPLLNPLLNLDLADNDLTQTLDARRRKELLQTLLVDCLRAEAAHTPLLIVLEACQWLDPLSLELLVTISRALVDLPVLLVIAFRPLEREGSELAAVRSLAHYREVELPPLTTEEASELVRLKLVQLAGPTTVIAPELSGRLAVQAEGNPFYLEELLNYLHARGVDFADADALASVELPDSLQRLVLSLVDQLSESQKITVKVASVIGRIFRAAWLHGVYPELGDPSRIHADLESLRQQEVMGLEPGEPELVYLFRQVITQGVTYESLPFAVKMALHEQIGQFIETHYPDTLDHYLDLLAYHYDHSPNRAKQRHYLRRAGEVAQANYANLAAIDYFQRLLRALDPEQQGEILLKLGQVLDTIGQYEEADERLRTGLSLADAQGDTALQIQGQIALGELRRKQSQYEQAAACFSQAQRLAEQAGDQAGVAKALICAGSLALYQGHYTQAQDFYARSLAIRRQLDDQPNIANLLNNLAITAASQGDFAQARTLFEESLAIRRQLRDRWGVTNSLNNLGQLAVDQAAYADARAYLEEAVTGLRAIGDQWSLGNALVTLGNAVRAQQDLQAAYPLYQESLQIYRVLGDRRMLAYLLENIGGLLALQGHAVRALHLVGAAAAVRVLLGTPLSPAEQTQLDEALAPARQALGDQAAQVWSAGQAMSLEQAVSEALSM
jgi:adenylate cyclase